MRILLLLALLCTYDIANANNYYFSSSTGDDSRTTVQAQNPATPWKTLSKLNSFSSSLNAGDNIFFQRGDVFYGTITINKAGNASNRITIGAYGTGADPLVTGFSSITSWTNLGGNIWESTSAVTTLSECNIISINGVNTAYGRMPKTGYRTIQSATTTSIQDNSFLNAGTQNWTGANVVTKVYRWHIARAPITSASGGTINFSSGVEDDSPPQGGWGYFIQNHPACLTQQNDWCFISSTKKIRIYSTSQPVNVKVPTIENGAEMNFNYITFDNINFTGFNLNGIELNGQSNISAQNCNFSFIALGGIYNDATSGGDLTVSNCTFSECNAYGVRVRRMTNTIVENSVFDKIGNLLGMAGHGNTVGSGLYTGIQMANGKALYNRLTNCGYNGITWNGSGTLIQGNYVHTFNYIKDDGGGIYTFPMNGESPIESYGQRRVVRDNICINGVGNGEGTPNPDKNEAACIYNDGNSAEIDYINNSMSSAHYGLFFHGGQNNTVIGNTIYNTTRGFHLVKYTTETITNNTVNNNIFTAVTGGSCQDGQYCAYYEPDAGNLPASLTLSNNIYGRPLDQSNGWIWRDFGGSNICNTLDQWKSVTGKDAGSTQSPITISDISKMRFEYNETSEPKVISLGATYIDMRSVSYPGTITLQPYTSAVLLKTGTGNVPPVANAGSDLNITLPTNNVNLSGTGTDPDGTITAYNWTKISGPTSGTITNSNSATTSVTGLVQGVYQFQLRVTDNGGSTDTDTMQVTVNQAPNQAPTANAGLNQNINLPLNSVSLSGSGTDPDGTITSYSWVKISGPTGENIGNASAATTTVTGLVQGIYQFELTVTDNNGATDTDIMQVTVNPPNQAPAANAGLDQSITLPVNSVSLNGSGTDPDGTITSYSWVKISGPTGGNISNASAATTTVTGLIQGVYQFELTVTDNSGATDTDIMQVTVNQAVNQAPTANAGLDQSITLPVNSVSLNGSGTDPDGTITSYSWVKISGPTSGNISNASAATTTVTGLIQGVYQFELTVTDNSGATDTDIMQVTVNPFVNQAPTANAGLDQNITLPVNSISLNGSGTDPDGTISSYLWTKISGPTGGTITNSASATTSVTALTLGVYRFVLRVTDNSGATDTDTMQVTVNPVVNQAPTANAGLDQNITLPVNSISLNGSGTDPDGTISSYLWTKIAGPTGGTITNSASATTSVTALTLGVYRFVLRVTDNSGATDTDTMQVTVNPVVNQAPTANAGLDQTITLPANSISLNGSGTDPDGTISSYLWTKIAGPTGGTINNSTSATTSVTALTQGVYRFVLRVTDNSGATDTDTMQVTVNPAANQAPTANAGLDQNITLPVNSVSLNGSGTDPDGTISSYLWAKISGPTGGTITNSTSAATSVTTLTQGVYRFVLRVTDNSGATDTDTMQVIVNPVPNQPPTANAGLDQNITLPVNNITLNGSGTDPDGTITAYSWVKISGPTGGNISNASAATTSVTGLVQGVYQFELTVTDNSGATDTDVMQVIVNPVPNQPPTANAGLDQNITLPVNSVSLNGIGVDPDGIISAYRWRRISGPTTYSITSTTTAATTVTGLVQGVYRFELRVTDNNGATGFDTMQVTVNQAINQLPTANAGLDQSITLPVNSISLNGSGTDPDGTITAYLWTKVSGPAAGTISNPTSAATIVTGLVEGIYRFELKVTDNSAATDTDTMLVIVNAAPNQAPTAEAGLNQSVTLPVNTVTLSGSGTDPDGTISSYSWVQISGPAGAAISNSNDALTAVTGLVQGIYQFELTVTDNDGATDTDVMQVNVNAALPPPNQAPTANAGQDQVITLPVNTVSLDGIGSDPDGTISAYRWRKISGPTTYTITNTTTVRTTATGLVQGIYLFEFRVTDNTGGTGFDTMQVTVNAALPPPNQAPVAFAGLDQNITLPVNSVLLSGSAADPDGNITTYVWSKISGPANGTITTATSAITSVTGLVQGVYLFQLRVTDNNGAADTDTIQVTVNPALNQAPTAEAGPNQTITLPVNTVTLSGSGTDPDGTISSFSWVKISGPASGTITSTTAASTSVTGLVQGIYQFQLTVTDNNGATDTDIMQVNVNAALPPPNQAPTANAGQDQVITLPVNAVSLSGSGNDPDGTISAYRWRRISGPTTYTITSTTTAATTVTGLVQGVYRFELRVTDNSSATDFDTMQVTVNEAVPPPNQLPVAVAGNDTIIYLPDNSVSLSGSGFDSDGFIVSYNWSIISGTSFLLTNATNAIANLNSLEQGIYEAELTVTDNNGASSRDTVKIVVGAGRVTRINDDVRILGNPVQNTLVAEISSSTTNRLMKIVLYNINGVLLYEKSLRLSQNVQLERIDMTKYSKGTYILQVYFDKVTPVIRKALKM